MIKQVTVTHCICERCGHEWEPEIKHGESCELTATECNRRNTPKRCPRCRSERWNEPRSERKD